MYSGNKGGHIRKDEYMLWGQRRPKSLEEVPSFTGALVGALGEVGSDVAGAPYKAAFRSLLRVEEDDRLIVWRSGD